MRYEFKIFEGEFEYRGHGWIFLDFRNQDEPSFPFFFFEKPGFLQSLWARRFLFKTEKLNELLVQHLCCSLRSSKCRSFPQCSNFLIRSMWRGERMFFETESQLFPNCEGAQTLSKKKVIQWQKTEKHPCSGGSSQTLDQ